ncbi:hypothetical protein CLOM_g8151 [Closterium sp. NIES-68]|nr:hypothetical protein CLOM_g8151 [Closterium sp. NIES-68]GJP68238.1 hypothetical protein CLOP_g24964 [Closterium sp. NIES-67]
MPSRSRRAAICAATGSDGRAEGERKGDVKGGEGSGAGRRVGEAAEGAEGAEGARPVAVHFIGIGGSGLSALAAVALKQGYLVSGSDSSAGAQVQRVRQQGATVHVGHSPAHIDAALQRARLAAQQGGDAQGRAGEGGDAGAVRGGASGVGEMVVVASSAVPADNVEVMRAKQLGVAVLKRWQWLGMMTSSFDLIAVAGTHGKSTTTAMLTWTLRQMGVPLAAVIGANVPQLPGGGNALVDDGASVMVLEADEYDGAFLELSPSIAVVTNVEWEHVDLFESEAAVRSAFSRFTSRVKRGGVLVACGDNAGSRALVTQLRASKGGATAAATASTSPCTSSNASEGPDCSGGASARAAWLDAEEDPRTAVTYGLDEGNDWRAIMLAPNQAGGTDYVTVFAGRPMARVSLQLPGVHNVLNSLAVLVVAAQLAAREAPTAGDAARVEAASLELQRAAVARAAEQMGRFEGAERRFQVVGRAGKWRVTCVDDYAHHPSEVRAVLQAARQRYDQQPIWVVFQPHTFSRLAQFMDDFAPSFSAADRVIVTQVYSAREENRWDVSGADLAINIIGPPAVYVPSLDDAIDRLEWEVKARCLASDTAMASTDSTGSTTDGGASSDGSSVGSSETALWEGPLGDAVSIAGGRHGLKAQDVVVLTLGAGDITRVGPALLERLSSRG